MDRQDGLDDAERQALDRQSGSYIFQNLIQDVPLSEDGQLNDVWISCAELWSKLELWSSAVRFQLTLF